jgi:hypothetical protein
MAIHLPYGGSSAHRTIGCPGWLKKSENLPPRPAGAAAIEGSMHHQVMEHAVRATLTPEDFIGMVYAEPGTDITRTYTVDDVDLTNIAFHATHTLLDDLDIDIIEVEPFVQLVPGVAGGSIDLLGLSSDETTLLIADYKFGSVAVPVEESPNLALYAISARHDSFTADLFDKVERIVFAIIQPRVTGVVKTWETNTVFLELFEARFKQAMELDHLSPGAWCNWCPAAPYCEAKRGQVMAANLLSKDKQDELNAAAAMVTEIETWVKAVKEEIYLQMIRGVPVDGWKVVQKRPTTKWTDEAGARAFLKSKRIAAKSITKPAATMTPIQVAEVLRKKGHAYDLSNFIVSESSGTTAATLDDQRDAVIVGDVQGELKDMME